MLAAMAQATATDPHRLPGHGHGVPASRGAGEHGGNGGHRLRTGVSTLGLGAGWNQEECDATASTLPPLKERFDRFDEGVETIARLLTQDTTTSMVGT